MSMNRILNLIIIGIICLSAINCEVQQVTAQIYADNYFEFYVNGKLIKKDPLDFTPHNAVKFTFDVTKGEKRVYAIKASDFATESGYEYTQTSQPQLGDGALRILMSDGTVTSSAWKCFTTNFGPTDESNAAGCSATNLAACKLKSTPEPDNWKELSFNDASWSSAKEYTEAEAGWGMAPRFENGLCGDLTDGLTRQPKNPNKITTLQDECLSPKDLNWGSSKFIWQGDLKRDNSILCRFTTEGTASTPLSTSFVQVSLFSIILLLCFFI